MKDMKRIQKERRKVLDLMIKKARLLVIVAESMNCQPDDHQFTKEEMAEMRALSAEVHQRFHEYSTYSNILEVKRDG